MPGGVEGGLIIPLSDPDLYGVGGRAEADEGGNASVVAELPDERHLLRVE